MNFPYLDSNIPRNPAYGIYISQLVRYARICSRKDDFICRHRRLSLKLQQQGYKYQQLMNRGWKMNNLEAIIHYSFLFITIIHYSFYYFLHNSFSICCSGANKYLLLAECEVRTASYGPSFFPSFYGPSAKRTGHENKEGKNEDT